MKFEETGLSDELLRAVADTGYLEPTPIQEQAIPILLMGRDMVGLAQTGTGKTAAFTLPMIDILAAGRAKARMPRSLILEPTRELAMQVAESFEVYGKYHKLTKALLIGGVSFSDQERLIDRGVDVLIATPGRLLDHFERGKILLNDIKILVIDEADRMLDMGFIPDVEKIVRLLPPIRQTMLFSATMPPEIRRLSKQFLMNPKEVAVAPPASPAETVDQALVMVDARDKRKVLRHLIRTEDVKSALIFCNRKRDVGILYRSLKRHGFDARALHGDMSQAERFETLQALKAGEVRLLVCSDVAARGLDIQFLSHVFNFDVPSHAEDYIHRIGRTGRAGRAGRAITLATADDSRALAAIRKLLGKDIPRLEIPDLSIEAPAEDERKADGRRRGGRSAEPRSRRAAREASAPAKSAPAKSRTRKTEPERPAAAKSEPAPASAEQKPRRGKRRRRREDEGEDADRPVIGMGDHVPAFMLRGGRAERR